MKTIFTILLLLFIANLHAQTTKDSIRNSGMSSAEEQLKLFQVKQSEEFKKINERLDYQQKLNEQTVDSISNQLSAASYSLTLFGILFAIGAIGVGVYVTYVERKIVKIGEENRELLAKNQKIKNDVEALNQLIQKDIYGLFIQIKREETVHILERLIKVPKDVMNVGQTLLSRELLPEDFLKLKIAYLNIENCEDNHSYTTYYKLLFFQHFFDIALKDSQIRGNILDFIPSAIEAAFENDILKSTSDFINILLDKGIYEFRPEINLFFKGLANSHHKNFLELYQLIFDQLKTRKNRFDLFDVVESKVDRRIAKIAYGNILLQQYSKDNPTESELLIFKELNALINTQNKADEEARQKVEEQKMRMEARRKQNEQRENEAIERHSKT